MGVREVGREELKNGVGMEMGEGGGVKGMGEGDGGMVNGG